MHQYVEDGEELHLFYSMYEGLPPVHMDLATRWNDLSQTLLYRYYWLICTYSMFGPSLGCANMWYSAWIDSDYPWIALTKKGFRACIHRFGPSLDCTWKPTAAPAADRRSIGRRRLGRHCRSAQGHGKMRGCGSAASWKEGIQSLDRFIPSFNCASTEEALHYTKFM